MTTVKETPTINVEQAVKERYSQAAQMAEASLCCAVQYDPRYLKVIPQEILERDYGCGDPSEYVREGETVLDLGSGSGKICYIAAQMVGARGRVIGVDYNEEMLSLANRYRDSIGSELGYHNVEFRKGKIQELSLDLDLVASYLKENPITTLPDLNALEDYKQQLRRERPLVADDSIDVVLSNCVLNLVRSEDKEQLFAEIFRVLKRGGRAVISDIVSDEDVPAHLQNDPELWSGCISGAFREDAFVEAFDRAGFYGMELVKRDEKPWRVYEGIEFRSVTVIAYKGKQGPCIERKQAVIYTGPWKKVIDDDGHVLERGKRSAVCEKTFNIYTREPYRAQILPIEPYVPVTEVSEFDCKRTLRHPKETKGEDYTVTDMTGSNCDSGSCC